MRHKEKEENKNEISKEKNKHDMKENDIEIKIEDQKKEEELSLKIQQLEKEVENYKDLLLRKAAEFENYKRRTENEQMNFFKYAAESFIAKLLPVIDDFERSLQYIDKTKEVEAIKEGIKLVYEKLMKLLDEQGIKKIDAVGKSFDVHFHEAMLQRKVEGADPNVVLDEIQSGYLYKDKVIRHSKVIVNEDSGDTTKIEVDSQNDNEQDNNSNGE